MSHTELISFLRSLPDTGVILIFYRDASRAQTPISTPTGDAVDLSRSHPNLTFLKSNSSFGKTNKPLRFEAKEMVRSLQVITINSSCSRNLKHFGNPKNGGKKCAHSFEVPITFLELF